MIDLPASASDVLPAQRLRQPALIVVDMQNDFVREGAPLEVADARRTLDATNALLAAFRARNRPVAFTRFISHEQPGLLWLWSPQCRPDTRCCWRDHKRRYLDRDIDLKGIDVIDELEIQPGDLIVDKHGYGAFHDTNLHERLQALEVESLVITGTVTQICVEETAREAFHYGYPTTIVTDAVSSFDPQLHAGTLKNFAMKYGWTEDSNTLLSWL